MTRAVGDRRSVGQWVKWVMGIGYRSVRLMGQMGHGRQGRSVDYVDLGRGQRVAMGHMGHMGHGYFFRANARGRAPQLPQLLPFHL